MSTAPDPPAAFVTALRTSKLLSPAQVTELAAWVRDTQPDVQALAKEVHRRGWLTPYQIKEVFRGRGAELVLGGYVLLDLLGEGGMGKVFKARQTRLGRDVALKVIRKERLKNPAAEARFVQEVRALAQMSHPNVVTVYDADQADDTHFYAMELIDGTDLTKVVRQRGPLPVSQACEYVRQAAMGLHHAYEMGLVHRDIKPSNLIVTRDERVVKVVDLGLARLTEADPTDGEAGRITQEGFVLGTPDFLAPEQARNPTGVDTRADIYALGGTLYYLLTAKVPFEGANATEKLLKHCTEPPPGILAVRPDAPPQLEQVIHWCLAKLPQQRPQTPIQLAMALQPFCPLASGIHAGPSGRVPYPAAHVLGSPAPVSDTAQAFALPAQTTSADPIRRRAKVSRFPVGLVAVGLGALSVAALLLYAAYGTFGTPKRPIETFTNSVGMKMVKLDGGTFRMGSPDNEPGRDETEGPPHEVTVRGPLLMAATEVTHSQYVKVMRASPSRSGGRAANASELPVEMVSYDDALAFCAALTEQEKDQPWARKKWAYRLPTEAEWEYAARAGTETAFSVGDRLIAGKHALFNPAESGDPGKAPDLPGRVGQFEPNAFGLTDVHGNVAEWCQDWYRRGYPGDGPRTDPTGPADGDRRVVRGGSFRDPASACRSAARAGLRPTERRDHIGFRVVYAPIQQ